MASTSMAGYGSNGLASMPGYELCETEFEKIKGQQPILLQLSNNSD
jgi:hypothetical protein